MSRKASLVGSRPAPVTSLSSTGSADDICPVCKTIRYLNKEMVFLINPECYHPMCSNCVNRLFAGPNQCPYAGCHKTLRRRDFHSAFFGDLTIEREVDIRKRVAAVFNKVEDDFEDLSSYNTYLEDVETLTMDLVGVGDSVVRRAAEAKLQLYEGEHRAEIEKNKRKSERADDATKKRLAAEQGAARRKRLEALEQDNEEKARRLREREEDLDSLTKAPEGAAGRVMLRRRGQHQKEDLLKMEEEELRRAAGGGLSIRGLKDKKRLAAVVDGPYSPFAGRNLLGGRYAVQEDYKDPRVQPLETRDEFTVPGYSLDEYYTRVMFDAFAGLGVFIDDEKETGLGTTAASVATLGASMAAESGRPAPVKMEVDDVF